MNKITITYIILGLFSAKAMSQTGVVYETYKTIPYNGNGSSETIFSKPFPQYNYRKTHRGVEVYENYTSTRGSDRDFGTIFSKPFPKYIIRNNKVYETYMTTSGTNKSRGTYFTKPIETKIISPKGLTYSGEGDPE